MIGSGVSEGEGPLQALDEGGFDPVDVDAVAKFEQAGVVGADAAAYRADKGERPADPVPRHRCVRVAGEVGLDVVVGGSAARIGNAAQHGAGAGHQRRQRVEQQPLQPALLKDVRAAARWDGYCRPTARSAAGSPR
ncbi:hypothetical protein ACPC39_33120 [Streptomyces cellulosae]